MAGDIPPRPLWRSYWQAAENLAAQARDLKRDARDARCKAKESGGVQCDLDAGHSGGHWIDMGNVHGPQV